MPVAHIVYRLSFVHEEFGSGYKKHEVFRPGFEKNLFQPFLGFPDVVADYTGAIDLVSVGVLFFRDDPCRDGLVEEGAGSVAFCLTR
ncbi:MAG: hypothetical protein JSV55_11990 [Deltaproteobacteria bacterium]|nr:MAG: hypothetical protein JSV55_11990 [Deltaproteobacteria bacterium]